jgi:hypothetical protein
MCFVFSVIEETLYRQVTLKKRAMSDVGSLTRLREPIFWRPK